MDQPKSYKASDEYNWIMDVSEPNQLRNAVYEMKQYYINKLIEANLLDASAKDECTLTVSQLKTIMSHHRVRQTVK
ncbi:hypothetical protein [Halobacillus sp. B23F22_1]|uniref:hypothetical protein n=1 Tax=Halobacillus sp. B23F22_1 TaxID=3459514 RepID=UPI00373DF35A